MAKFGQGHQEVGGDKLPARRGDKSIKQSGVGFFSLPPVYEHNEPRCKVCQSPFRREIDSALASGWSQAAVIKHYNAALGEDYFTRGNMSRHKARHLSVRDAAVRNIIEERARALSMDVDKVEGFILTRQATLDMIIQTGLEQLRQGITESAPKDIIAAIQMLEKMEQDFATNAVEEMTQQYKAFADAVQEIVPEEFHGQIFDRTKELLTERQVGNKVVRAELPKAQVEIEDADWDEEWEEDD